MLSRISDPAGQTITAWRVAGSITVGSAYFFSEDTNSALIMLYDGLLVLIE